MRYYKWTPLYQWFPKTVLAWVVMHPGQFLFTSSVSFLVWELRIDG